MPSKSMLLRGGTVLTHDANDHVHPIKADLLIEGNRIAKIEEGILASSETEIVDCTDKILSPGFIDTHHHVWQTLLKGQHANGLLMDYFPSGNFTSSLHNPADFFWGQLGGCLECLDVGTTTVVDHAHLNYSPDHTKAGLAATISSGIRSVFCYTPTSRLESWEPFAVNRDILPEWVMNLLEELGSKAPFNNERVQLGFAVDALWLPKEIIVRLFEKVKALGIKTITTHYVPLPILPPGSPIELLHSYGLLDSTILFSHASNATPADCRLLLETNSHVSSTPSTELQMAMTLPMAFRDDIEPNIQSQCSLGVDCHSNNSASMVSEMRLLLQASRNAYNEKFISKGKFPKTVNKTVEEAFNMGTIQGARAIGMQDKIGSLAVGKKADICIFDALSPSMVCAAQHDPVAAVVLHSSPADIECVIVDGVVRKKFWMLEEVEIGMGGEMWAGVKEMSEKVAWREVSKELIKRRVELQKQIEKLDLEAAKEGTLKAFYADKSAIVEKV